MFNDNWYLFILLILLMFAEDGEINSLETSLLIAISLVLASNNPTATENGTCKT